MADNEATLEGIRGTLHQGARTYLFYWYPKLHVGDANIGRKLVRSTSLPTSTVKVAEVPWQGYTYKIGAQQEFGEWTVNVNMDAQDELRKWLLNWVNDIHDPSTNIHGIPKNYMHHQDVALLNPKTLTPEYRYKLMYAWPSAIGEVSLDYSGAEVATYDITFQYQWFEAPLGG